MKALSYVATSYSGHTSMLMIALVDVGRRNRLTGLHGIIWLKSVQWYAIPSSSPERVT
jgi:hypothetical protein